MDIVGVVVSVATLAIVGLGSILTLLVQQLGWPKFLVRHFAAMRKPEIDLTVKSTLSAIEAERRERRARRRAAIEEAGRYMDVSDQVSRLIPAILGRDAAGNPESFAGGVPFFVDFMGASTDQDFADECALILASVLRANRGEIADFDFIAGIKAGSPLIAAALSRRLGVPLVLFRGRGRARRDVPNVAPYEAFDGDRDLLRGRALIVDDSTTGGTMVLDCAGALRACQGEVAGALVLAEIAGRNGRERLSQNGVPLFAVTRVDREFVAGLAV